jgi:exosortase
MPTNPTPGSDVPAAATRSAVWVGLIQAGLVAALLVAAYWSVLLRVVGKWASDGNWSHGWLIPLFSLYFVYLLRRPVARTPTSTNWAGLVALVCVLTIYFYFLFVNPMAYPQAVSLVVAIAAVVLLLSGWPMLRLVWFPILFLLFAVPLPDGLYVDLTMPLRKLATHVAAAVLELVVPDLTTDTSGVVIDYRTATGKIGMLNVEEACSGMRLMMAFVTLGAAMAYLGNRAVWQRAIMVLACVPIAVFCNIIRVTVTGLLHVYGREDLAEGAPHEFLGLAMLPIALGLFALLGYILDNLFVEVDEDQEQQSQTQEASA